MHSRFHTTADKSDTRRGFSLNYLLDLNECQIDNGDCEQICVNRMNGYECRCTKGYVLDAMNKRTCKQAPCNRHLSTSRGTFQSINFQNANITNVDCYYIFETLPGHLIKVKITFNNFLPTKSACLQSNLVVYDGSNRKDRVLYKFKDNRSKILLSSRNSMLITYYSNANCPHTGFQTSFINVCGGKYIATPQQQYIYSHSEFGNSTYKPLVDCKWHIKSKHSKHVRVKLSMLDIEEDAKCRFDNLMIYDGTHEDPTKLIATYCGNRATPNQTISTGNSLVIRFTTDDTRNFNGFALVYDEVDRNSDLIEYLT